MKLETAVDSRVLPDAATSLRKLSPAQRFVLTRIGQGKMTKEIADELKISEKGVGWHRTEINRKLGLHSVAEAVSAAIKLGLVVL